MEKFLKSIVSQVNGFWKGMDGPARRKFIIAAVSLLVAASVVTWLITKPEYAVLYSNLESQEAGEILQKLEEGKVDVKIEGSGTIKVPKRDEAKIRMNLAAEGYPKSGLNYADLTQGSMGLGATDYDKRKATQYQLQERLQTAIRTMEGVGNAIVTITIPEQDSFVLKEDRLPATASVLLKLNTDSLSRKQVQGIEDLVCKSVPGLKSENISIVDSNMNTLNVNEQSGAGAVSAQLELETQVKESLQRQVMKLLGPVFGDGNVLPSVSFHLNFDKKVVNSVKFEPVTDDTGIAVSINELKEEVSGAQDASGQTQYPLEQEGVQGGYNKNNRTINYEVNQINEQLEEAQGKMTDLKLSVLINSDSLDRQTLTNIQTLVANAIGVDEASVVIQAMVFNGMKLAQEQLEASRKEAQSKEFWERLTEIGKYVVLAMLLALILFILYRLVTNLRAAPAATGVTAGISEQAPAFIAEAIEMPEEDKEQVMKKQRIDNLIDNKPDIVAQQIRDWLNES